MNAFLRRALLGLLASLPLLPAPAIAAEVLQIGYQKYGTLVLLKARGTLEPELRRQGVEVRWVEFPGGLQLLEGLNVGSIDFGVAGETPPVFAPAAGAAFITPQVVAAQQRIADAFAREKLIPRPLQVAQVVWPPAPAAGR